MKHLFVVIFLAMQVAGVHAAKKYSNFTDTQGRTIRGCVVAYNAKSKIVSFERNKRTKKVPLSVFSEESQNEILSWQIEKTFMTDAGFKVSTGRRKTKSKKDNYSDNLYKQKTENAFYEIILENRSTMEMKDLKIEYRIYYEQEDIKSRRIVAEKGVFCGKISDISIPPKSKKEITTDAVKIFKKELSADYEYSDSRGNIQRGKIDGIWIRIYTELPSGKTIIREVSTPDKLCESKKWAKSSKNVGLN